MKIIIVGAGEIGRHLAERLSSEAHEIVVIEADEAIAAELGGQIDAKVLRGNGASITTLIDANAPECELFLALTSCNNTNLVCSSIAKQLGAQKVICRVHPEVQRDEWLFDYRARFGIDYLFSSERLAALDLSKFVRSPNSIFVEEIARGSVELLQIEVEESSEMTGKQLLELKLPERVRIGSIQRERGLIIPTANDELQIGDVVTLVGDPRKLHEVAARLGKKFVQESQRVVIFGGNEYGFSLAQMLLSWDFKVRILESDSARCEDLTNRLDGATILNIDATRISELREERVGEADFFIATTASDEDNVMTCLQAHNLGAKHCLTLIHRADYADAISSISEQVGIMAAVSPRESARQELMRFVTSDRYHVVRDLHDAEVIEATVAETSAIAGKQVNEIDWPGGSILVGLLHGIQAAVPAASDTINAGDNLYAIVAKAARKPFLKLLKK
ncbi:MAG: trk system potassium uptake protein TrkA [Verrucomicrobiales bacterium]|jgi:trk system potassium uptake protein TrkA